MRTFLLLALLGCSTAAVPPVAAPAASARSAPSARPVVAPATAHAPRFDELVRQDFFDGMRGDAAALARANQLCEDRLAANPDDAEPLVWHGAVLVARSVPLFRDGHVADAMPLWQAGLAEMDRAVALAPDSVGVRIPRGAVLLGAAPHLPEPERSRLLALGAGDYAATLALQEPRFRSLSLHAREQLLYGLTDAYANLGQLDRARDTVVRMERDAADSKLLDRARARAGGQAVDGETPCEQCHAR